MAEDIRERTTLPLAVPFGIFAVILVIVFLFSRILLNVPRQVAVVVALMTALNILITCGIIAMRKVEGGTKFLLVLVIAVPVVLGGAAAAKIIKIKAPPAPPAPPAATVVLSAANTAYSTTSLTLSPGTATIDFKNMDTAPHNVHIYDGADASAPSVFMGNIVPPGGNATYNVTGLKDGSTYFFHCDVHPTQMTGKITVSSAGASAAGPVSSGPIFLSAANTQFNKQTITIAANKATTVMFHNADSSTHNFDIISGPPPYAKPATQPTPAAPSQSVTYNIPALPPGTYDFQCDFHPGSMKGTLTVQ